jgi:hypothetical protein
MTQTSQKQNNTLFIVGRCPPSTKEIASLALRVAKVGLTSNTLLPKRTWAQLARTAQAMAAAFTMIDPKTLAKVITVLGEKKARYCPTTCGPTCRA